MPRPWQSRSRSAHDCEDSRNPSANATSSLVPSARTPRITSRHTLSGIRGHMHHVELDQFVGRNYLVTVHGPLNPAVKPDVAYLDKDAVLRRFEEKRLQVLSPFELATELSP